MIARIGVRIRQWKRFFNRSYWAIRLFGLSKSDTLSTTPGLVLIQIDGLSFNHLQRGMREKNLPFLNSLKVRQGYSETPHYSGLPSNTPAVQGELFYGIKSCVPAFSFRDKESGKPFLMFDPECAKTVEERLKAGGNTPLLEGGSSYANIFEGGAAEAHYCASSGGFTRLLKIFNPFRWLCVIVFHPAIFIRTFVLVAIEIVIALKDCIRGILSGQKIPLEVPFILSRALLCVLLRELIVMEAKIDIARGLPIIHVNLFGYDEQAHRRGPSSKFAHWSLKGIDGSVKRLWREARLAQRRDYDVWIYSDHGQQDVTQYLSPEKETIDDVIAKIFGEKLPSVKIRAQHTCCGGNVSRNHPQLFSDPEPKVKVLGLGPIGHIYAPVPLKPEERERVISEMLAAGVPAVLLPKDPGAAQVHTRQGIFSLPEDAAKVLGGDHPFIKEAAEDLIALCHHPNAGDIVFSGWYAGVKSLSFPSENGSHAGFGPEETKGFVLLPPDAPLTLKPSETLRPMHLREAVLRYLGKIPYDVCELAAPCGKALRVLTYNVHGCAGFDGKVFPERIARVIARHHPDVVALQELDVGRNRSGLIHQAQILAKQLRMEFQFQPSLRLAEGEYGNAILSRYPLKVIRMDALPRLKANRVYEPRGALWVQINLEGTPINLITTHLSLWPAERLLQIEALFGPEWLGNAECKGAKILCGDFNANSRSPVWRRAARELRDAQLVLESHKPHGTWLANHPLSRIDHVFISPEWDVTKILISKTELDRVASDHLPFIVDLNLKEKCHEPDRV